MGVLNVRDYYCMTERTKEQVLEKIVQPAFFIPESVRADVLFRKMKQNHCHFAVVLDEYGGMEGVITINDLLEELVGDFEEEEVPDIVCLDGGAWQIPWHPLLWRTWKKFCRFPLTKKTATPLADCCFPVTDISPRTAASLKSNFPVFVSR